MKKILLVTILLFGMSTSLSADITTPKGAKEACDGGDHYGCYYLGVMYEAGKGEAKLCRSKRILW